MECIACHSGMGNLGYFNAKLAASRKEFNHFVVYTLKMKVTLEDAVCLRRYFISKEDEYIYGSFLPDSTVIPCGLHLAFFKDEKAAFDGCLGG